MRSAESSVPTSSQRVLENLVWSWGGHAVFVVAGFIMPRFVDQRLGQTALGVWDFGWSIVAYFGLVQLGINSSINPWVARSRAVGDVERLRRVVSSVLLVQVVNAAVVFLVTALAAMLIPGLLSARLGQWTDEAQVVVALLGTSVAVQIGLGTFSGVLTGCHRFDVYNGIGAGFHALSLAGMYGALTFGGGLRAMAAVYFVGIVLTEVSRLVAAFVVCPELRVGRRYVHWEDIKEMFQFGGKAFVGTLSQRLLYQTNSILVLSHLGPAALALYSRPLALVNHAITIVSKFSFILTPLAGQMDAGGRATDLRRLFTKGTEYSAFMALPMGIALAVLGGPLLHVWMGRAYVQGPLLAILALGHVAVLAHRPAASVLVAIGAHGRPAFYALLAALGSIPLCLLAVGPAALGLQGAALALVLPIMLVDGLWTPVYACRRLGIPVGHYFMEAWRRPVLCAVPFAICLMVARTLDPVAALAASLLIGGPVLGVTYWVWALPPSVRDLVSARLAQLSIGRHHSTVSRFVLCCFLRAVLLGYRLLLWMATAIGRRTRSPRPVGYEILLTGTFHAESWAASHLAPLARSSHVARIRMVAVHPVPDLPKVEGVYPPSWLCRTVGGVPARLLTFFWIGMLTRPDIVGGFHLLFNGLAAALLARLSGARSMYFCVGGITETLHDGRSENRLFARLRGTPDAVVTRHLLKAIAAFDLVITMGSGARQFLLRHGVTAPCHVVAGGMDCHRFDRSTRTRSIDLITVCRLVPVKRLDRLLQAVRRVRDVVPGVSLTIVGDGSLRATLEHMTDDLGIRENVTFAGHQVDVDAWLARAKIFVLTSDSEGLSLALMEANMAGVPAVVSDVGDLRDLVEDGRTGYLIAERTPDAFAARIVDLLTDDGRRARFSEAARRSAQRYDAAATARKWDEILGPTENDESALALTGGTRCALGP